MSETSQVLRVKNFERFQHYKDRNPIWIKLYLDLLNDYAFAQLSNSNKWIYIGLLLLASRTGNAIPNDERWITERLSLGNEGLNLQPFLDAGFVMLADCYQNAPPSDSKALAPLLFSSLVGKDKQKSSRTRTKPGDGYSPAFEKAWLRYPKRPNNNKPRAWQQWSARVKAGDDEAKMLAGTLAYAAYIAAEQTPPGYIKQAATFYGPNRHYLDDFTPTRTPAPITLVDGIPLTPRQEALRKMGLPVPNRAG